MMKTLGKYLVTGLSLALLAACGGGSETHFMTDKAYRKQVEADFSARPDHLVERVPIFDKMGHGLYKGEVLTQEEKEALTFLYAYMPLADAVDYPAEYFLDQVRASFRIREEMGWNVPEREFRHFVLPVRVNNENLDTARVVFYRELKPRVQGLSMEEAILEVNHWCHEKMTYQPSDARTSSPLASVQNALGRCGEESTFCVAALRSVGIPARQVYTPRWAHTDDNHAWVEAWADGQWHFLGACEPEPVLDLGWFNAPASRAMLMHTKVFGRYDGPEEVVLESPNFTEINLIDHYATTARADFRVVDASGAPVEGARVDFCIYNYAEFYPAVSKYTDADGRTFLSSGLGDLLVWASKDGAYGFAKCSFGKDTEVTITLGEIPGQESLDIVPPPENVRLPEVTPAQRAENDRRAAREDSLRHAYEATFPTHEEALAFTQKYGYGHHMVFPIEWARGNWRTIEAFMAQAEDHEWVEPLLLTLSRKDFHDVTLEVLMDSYNNRDAILGPRVENEFLSPYKGFFKEWFNEYHRQLLSDPDSLVNWVRREITVYDDPKAWNIPATPIGTHQSGIATPRSRGIYFVALARTLGIDAQKDPVTGKIQYRLDDGDWLDVDFDGAGPAVAAPQGTLKLTYTPNKIVDNPRYYSHFTLSKIENGRPRLLEFDEGEVDMGGGVDWAHVFRQGFPLEAGRYLLVSGNRLPSGAVPVSMVFFDVVAGQETVVPLVLRSGEAKAPVLGTFGADTKFVPVADKRTEDGDVISSGAEGGVEKSILSVVAPGPYALAILDPGKEPTNHVLRDLAVAREKLESWGRPIVLLCSNETAMHRLQVEMSEGRYGLLPDTIILGLDSEGTVQKGIEKSMKIGPESASGASTRLPLVILADTSNNVYFLSEGYTIGLGEQLAATVAKL